MIEGLVVISEIDSPLTIISNDEKGIFEELNELPSNQYYYERFRKRMITEKDWFSEARKQEARHFAEFFVWMDKHVNNQRLVRKGDIRVTNYIYGRINDEFWGISFETLET